MVSTWRNYVRLLTTWKPIDKRSIKRALISVYNKTGLRIFARALGEAGVRLSPPTTAARIAAAGVAAVNSPVDDA